MSSWDYWGQGPYHKAPTKYKYGVHVLVLRTRTYEYTLRTHTKYAGIWYCVIYGYTSTYSVCMYHSHKRTGWGKCLRLVARRKMDPSFPTITIPCEVKLPPKNGEGFHIRLPLELSTQNLVEARETSNADT